MFLTMMNQVKFSSQWGNRQADFHQHSAAELLVDHPAGQATDADSVTHGVFNRLRVTQFHDQIEIRHLGQQQVVEHFTRTGPALAQDPRGLRSASSVTVFPASGLPGAQNTTSWSS